MFKIRFYRYEVIQACQLEPVVAAHRTNHAPVWSVLLHIVLLLMIHWSSHREGGMMLVQNCGHQFHFGVTCMKDGCPVQATSEETASKLQLI